MSPIYLNSLLIDYINIEMTDNKTVTQLVALTGATVAVVNVHYNWQERQSAENTSPHSPGGEVEANEIERNKQ